MNIFDGPTSPTWPARLVHPHGPLFRLLPVALRRHVLHLRATGRWGNFRNPRTRSEKMQWRIINDRRPMVAMSCDKLASKEYAREVAAAAGLKLHIPETYWVGTDVRELQALAARLPNRWVLKPNHSSGRYALIDSAVEPIEWERLANVANRWLLPDEEEQGLGHWGYSAARHLLFAEERVGDGSVATSIRVQTVSGAPLFFSVDAEFPPITKRWIYNAAFTQIGRHIDRFNPGEVPSVIDLMSVKQRDEIAKLAAALTKNFDQQRFDLYFENGQLWFSEFSIYATSGLGGRLPERDKMITAAWRLPADPKGRFGQERFVQLLALPPKGMLS